MGQFIYEESVKTEIEDRALFHLQFVIVDKLRRNEAFPFTWFDDPSYGQGRTTVWLSSQANIVFKYYGSRQPELNRAWLEALAVEANSLSGLRLTREPTPEPLAGMAGGEKPVPSAAE
ncbi:DUF7882 family protein [Microbacterium terrisoli]|jgi:hypothetical protein|uniref:DUF7882 family protein n=1 Tax=Microbacterium terrisoli TaxID=3242192 RepID=UPI002805CCA5|nr:ATP-dependent DNA ligase [Microbacterium protaetiae]